MAKNDNTMEKRMAGRVKKRSKVWPLKPTFQIHLTECYARRRACGYNIDRRLVVPIDGDHIASGKWDLVSVREIRRGASKQGRLAAGENSRQDRSASGLSTQRSLSLRASPRPRNGCRYVPSLPLPPICGTQITHTKGDGRQRRFTVRERDRRKREKGTVAAAHRRSLFFGLALHFPSL